MNLHKECKVRNWLSKEKCKHSLHKWMAATLLFMAPLIFIIIVAYEYMQDTAN